MFISFPRPSAGTLQADDYSYRGGLLDGVPDGYGQMTFKNGDSYSGDFKAGKFDKNGIYRSKSGHWRYTGPFVNGQADGRGTLSTPDGHSHTVTYQKGVLKK